MNLSNKELGEVLNSIDRDQYPEKYNMVLQAYEETKSQALNGPSLPEKMDSIEKGSPSPIKAIIVGSLIDILGGIIIKFFLPVICSSIYTIILYKQGLDFEKIEAKITGLTTAPFTYFITFAAIMIVPFIAGLICAKIAKGNAVMCALVVGVSTSIIGILIGINTNIDDALSRSLFYNITSFVFIISGSLTYMKMKFGFKSEN
ncbi:MAG: hypothetical protein GY710_25605 [Desulfobacteraceae bacterium]|nr:hypothetical protein [Desulfobacteraceae bacterium]